MEKLVISEELENKLKNYCRLLEEDMIRQYPTCIYNHYKYKYKIMNKFIKIIRCSYKGEEESVWCFVDSEGNLYKPAGWSKPAQGIRGHIDKPIINGYGFYLRW